MKRLEPNTPFNVQVHLHFLNDHWTRCIEMKPKVDTTEPAGHSNFRSLFKYRKKIKDKKLKADNKIFKERIRRRVLNSNDYKQERLRPRSLQNWKGGKKLNLKMHKNRVKRENDVNVRI